MYKVFNSWTAQYVDATTFEEALAVKAQMIENYVRDNLLFPISHVEVTEDGEIWAGCDENGNRIAN